jgi:hypothetical protein
MLLTNEKKLQTSLAFDIGAGVSQPALDVLYELSRE